MKSQEEVNLGSSTASIPSAPSLHIEFDRDLSLPWTVDEGRRVISGRIDYSLWHSQPGCLETNCVMVDAKREDYSSGGVVKCLSCMGKLEDRTPDMWTYADCHFSNGLLGEETSWASRLVRVGNSDKFIVVALYPLTPRWQGMKIAIA